MIQQKYPPCGNHLEVDLTSRVRSYYLLRTQQHPSRDLSMLVSPLPTYLLLHSERRLFEGLNKVKTDWLYHYGVCDTIFEL